MSNSLKKEFEYYIAHQDEMVEKYDGKFVVIRDGQVLGAYDDELAAINETKKTHELGTLPNTKRCLRAPDVFLKHFTLAGGVLVATRALPLSLKAVCCRGPRK